MDNKLIINNNEIEIRDTDNFVNVTQICKLFNRYPSRWNYFIKSNGKFEKYKEKFDNFIEIKAGGKIQGTWIHPQLIVEFVEWACPSMKEIAQKWLENYMNENNDDNSSSKSDDESETCYEGKNSNDYEDNNVAESFQMAIMCTKTQESDLITLKYNNIEIKVPIAEDINNLYIAKSLGYTDEELKYVQLFWDPTFNGSWFYLTKLMVVEWFGFANNISTMAHFYERNLIKNYKKDIDYKEVDKNHEIVKKYYLPDMENGMSNESIDKKAELPGNRAKFYIITGNCLKRLIMTSHSEKGNQIRDYYIKTESLIPLMFEYIRQKEIKQKDLEIQALKNKAMIMHSKIGNLTKYQLDGYIYLATNKYYAQNNIFRLGRTAHLDNRLSNYQGGRTINDNLYYVFVYHTEDVETLETLLRKALRKFREDPSRDMYVLHWSLLQPFVEKICNIFHNVIIPDVNELIENNIKNLDEPVIPESYTDFNSNINDEEKTEIISNIEQKIQNKNETKNENQFDEVDLRDKENEILVEKLLSQEKIDNLANKFLQKKYNKRNEFIRIMNLLHLKVISEYITTEHNISLMCNEGHKFDIIPNNHNLERIACYECTNYSKTLNANQILKDNKIECVDYKRKEFKCDKGHVFTASNVNYILYKNGGCPVCYNQNRLTKQDFHNAAKANEGRWIEEENIPMLNAKTQWICKNGHTFQSDYKKVLTGNWKTICNGCTSPQKSNENIEFIKKIIEKFPTAELLTDFVPSTHVRIEFSCSHIKESWSVIFKSWKRTKGWPCNKCKEELT